MRRKLLARRPGRRALRSAAAIALVAALGLAAHLGWLSGRRPWQEATGWDRIPQDQRPPAGLAWSGEGEAPSISWLGHSGFLVRWHGAQLLLDPNTSLRCVTSPRVLEAALDVASLGRVDAVLLSHAHFDHLDLPTLRRLTDVGTVVLPRGAEAYLSGERWAEQRFAPLLPGECTQAGALEICGVAVQHEGVRGHPFHGRVGALGYVIRWRRDAIYFAGDTGARIPFEEIRDRHHPRIAILPIGAWLPRVPMKWYHLSPEEAAEAGARLGAETIIPCHFGTFTVSLDRPSWALPRFAAAAKARGLRWLMPHLATASEASP